MTQVTEVSAKLQHTFFLKKVSGLFQLHRNLKETSMLLEKIHKLQKVVYFDYLQGQLNTNHYIINACNGSKFTSPETFI